MRGCVDNYIRVTVMARQTTMHYFFPLPSDADRLLESVDLDQGDVHGNRHGASLCR